MHSGENNKDLKDILTEKNVENILNESQAAYTGFVHKSEDEKLREDIFRSPVEKLHLFTAVLRREAVLKTQRSLSHNFLYG